MYSKREGFFCGFAHCLPSTGSQDDEGSCAYSAQGQTVGNPLLGFAPGCTIDYRITTQGRSDSGIRAARGTVAQGTKVARPFAVHAFFAEILCFPNVFQWFQEHRYLLHDDPPCETEDPRKRTRPQGGTFVLPRFPMISQGSSTGQPGSQAGQRSTG